MKRLLGAFIILVLLFSLCACGAEPVETTVTTETTSAKPMPVQLTEENIRDYLKYTTTYENERITIKTWPKQPGKFIDCRIVIQYTSEQMYFPDGTNVTIEDIGKEENKQSQSYYIPVGGELTDSSVKASSYYSMFTSSLTDYNYKITFAEGTFYPD